MTICSDMILKQVYLMTDPNPGRGFFKCVPSVIQLAPKDGLTTCTLSNVDRGQAVG